MNQLNVRSDNDLRRIISRIWPDMVSHSIQPLNGLTKSIKLITIHLRNGNISQMVVKIPSKKQLRWEVWVGNQLNQKGIGPVIRMKFGNGYLSEYITGQTLKYHDLRPLLKDISRELAKWHTVQIGHGPPSSPDNMWFWTRLTQWINQINWHTLPRDEHPLHNSMNIRTIRREMKAIKKMVKPYESGDQQDWVWSHQDLTYENMVWKSGDENRGPDGNPGPARVWFIDYDYVDYHHRAYDIANFFNEWVGTKLNKYGRLDGDLYPTENEQGQFLQHYLEAMGIPDDQEMFQYLTDAIAIYRMVSDFHWGIWGLHMSQKKKTNLPNPTFDYLKYGWDRLNKYYSHQFDRSTPAIYAKELDEMD